MHPSSLPIAALGFMLAVSPPAAAQGGYPDATQDSGMGHGKSYGFDNVMADTPAHDELAIGAALVKQQKYAEAITHLELAKAKRPRNASILIYLGFAHRMLATNTEGDAQAAEFKQALAYYDQALAVDPGNKLLHEYLGKLYLLTREYALAANELKTLERLCPSQCAERTALSQAVAANPAP